MISYNLELNDWMSMILQIGNNFYVISLQVLTKKKQNSEHKHIPNIPNNLKHILT